jgi:hypothetical protein
VSCSCEEALLEGEHVHRPLQHGHPVISNLESRRENLISLEQKPRPNGTGAPFTKLNPRPLR